MCGMLAKFMSLNTRLDLTCHVLPCALLSMQEFLPLVYEGSVLFYIENYFKLYVLEIVLLRMSSGSKSLQRESVFRELLWHKKSIDKPEVEFHGSTSVLRNRRVKKPQFICHKRHWRWTARLRQSCRSCEPTGGQAHGQWPAMDITSARAPIYVARYKQVCPR